MKVLMINGSPRAGGNTAIALSEMQAIFAENGIETELIQVGNRDIRGCISCHLRINFFSPSVPTAVFRLYFDIGMIFIP